jgi:hypothetical protein
MTTYAGFLAALSAMAPTGVTRVFAMGATPPASLNAADLPALWVQLPKGEHDIMTFQSGAHWPTYHAEVVIAVLPTAQGMNLGKAFEDTVTVMDNLITALAAVRPTGMAGSKPIWTMRQGSVTVAGTEFWAVIAEVTASG